MTLTDRSRGVFSLLLGAGWAAALLICSVVAVAAAPAGDALGGPALGASAAQGMVIVSSSYYRDGDSLYLVGEVRNDTELHVNGVTIAATYFDDSGNVLGTASANTEHETLGPGQISPFIIFDLYPEGLTNYVLAVEAAPTATLPVPPLSILSVREINSSGVLTLVGELQNTHTVTVSNAKVIVTLYDASGTVINAQSDFAFNELLLPGQKSPFRVVLSAGPTAYAGRAIGTDTRESAATPPDLYSVSVTRSVDGQGVLHFSGQVRNRGQTEARIVKAMVTLYDASGGVVNCDFSYTEPSTIGPGGAAVFDIAFGGDSTGWSSYSVYPPEDVIPTPTATPGPSPTATATPPTGNLLLTGRVYDASAGPTQGIANARVSVTLCFPLSFEARSDSAGHYELLLLGQYLNQCPDVLLEVTAPDYEPFMQLFAVEVLRAEPQRDIALFMLVTPTHTATATPVGWQSPTPTHTPTPTSTPTPPGDLMLTGHVFDAIAGPQQGIARALVSVLMCMPGRFDTLSGVDGFFQLLLPAQYLNQCNSVTLEVMASGYVTFAQPVPVAELRAQPQRDFAMLPKVAPTPSPTGTLPGRHSIYLPTIWRRHFFSHG